MSADDEITLTADRWTVSATEQISTGEYENYQPHVKIEGDVPLQVELDQDTRTELKARLLGLHKEAQAILQRACENRIAEPGHEDWGVSEGTE